MLYRSATAVVKTPRELTVLLVGFFLLAATRLAANDPDGTVSPMADYSSELPRIPPQEPLESLSQLVVHPDFEVQLVAAEPLVVDPVAISFDPRGRMYVVCMRGYSEQADELLGQVRLLTDTDDDGDADTSTVFMDRLSWPTGVLCYDGGVFVAVAPDILYAKDSDGDGKADIIKKVFTGFARSNVQGLVNSLRWGLDHRIHGATSRSGGIVSRADGTSKPLDLRGRDFAFDPRTLELTATPGGAQHGFSFDDWGRKYVCSNSRHIEMVYYDERYIARNPLLVPPPNRVLIAVDGGQAEVYRISPVEPWRIVRTRLRKVGSVPGPVEGGGRAAGYFTAATGITIYRGDAWDRKHRGRPFIGDVGSNIIHRKILQPESVGFLARRMDSKKEFLASPDNWFRPVQMANSPDGNLYVLDMYREVIEHPLSVPPIIKKHLDLTSGRDRGRIYRIVPKSHQLRSPPNLDEATTEQLVAMLDHRNAWHRETAARLLYTRQDLAAIEPLRKLAVSAKTPQGRIQALYSLKAMGALTANVVLPLLKHDHARAREQAIRLLEPFAADSSEVRERLYAMTRDVDARVRYQLAFTLGEVRDERRYDAFKAIIQRDPKDEWIRLACLSSLNEGLARVFKLLVDDKNYLRRLPSRLDYDLYIDMLGAFAEQIARRGISGDKEIVLRSLPQHTELRPDLVKKVVEHFCFGLGKRGDDLWASLDGNVVAQEALKDNLAFARRGLEEMIYQPRITALKTLRLSSFAAEGAAIAKLLDSRQPRAVQREALTTLSTFDDAGVADVIISAWPSLSPSVRPQAAEVLLARANRLPSVLGALESETMRASDLGAARIKSLRNHADDAIRERARKIIPENVLARRADVTAAYRRALDLPGNPTRGKEIFQANCATCHRVEGVGFELGPNLVAMQNRGAEAILMNVLDPNRELDPKFTAYVVTLQDGRVITGIIEDENPNTITLQRGDNQKDVVARKDILGAENSGLSLMPEGFEEKISVADMAHLLAYLMSAR